MAIAGGCENFYVLAKLIVITCERINYSWNLCLIDIRYKFIISINKFALVNKYLELWKHSDSAR